MLEICNRGTSFTTFRTTLLSPNPLVSTTSFKSQSTRGSKIFGNGRKQPYLKLCLLKASLLSSNTKCGYVTGNLNFTPMGAILAQKSFQNLPTLHVSCQNTRKPIINQMMFPY